MRSELKHLESELPFAIIGMGLTGEATLKMLLSAGVSRNQIKTFDEKNLADYSDPEILLKEFSPKTLIVSPGVPLSSLWIKNAQKKGLKIRSELELATYFLTSESVIGITGSIGKSTTTALLYEAAKKEDAHAFVGGNFGIPLAHYVDGLMHGKPKAKYVILELSSFQLENYSNLNAKIGIVTYLSANHLERYDNQAHYFETKLKLLEKTNELAICNLRGGSLSKMEKELKARFPNLKFSFVDRKDFSSQENRRPSLVGDHNLDNLAMAYAVAEHLKWSANSRLAMLSFRGLSHRLENVGTFKEILFLNDSKSTTIDSVLEAVQSIKDENKFSGKIHLLLGGKDKNLPWENLSSLKENDRFQFHFFGQYGKSAQEKTQLGGSLSARLGDCLNQLKNHLSAGDIVLLSPGGTSLDEFKSFGDRGDYFKNWVLSEFNN